MYISAAVDGVRLKRPIALVRAQTTQRARRPSNAAIRAARAPVVARNRSHGRNGDDSDVDGAHREQHDTPAPVGAAIRPRACTPTDGLPPPGIAPAADPIAVPMNAAATAIIVVVGRSSRIAQLARVSRSGTATAAAARDTNRRSSRSPNRYGMRNERGGRRARPHAPSHLSQPASGRDRRR